MKTVHLVRYQGNKISTIGNLTLPSGKILKILELPWRDNQVGISCIPIGSYKVVWAHSPRLGKFTFRVVNVPNRDGILFHSANWPHQLKGCLAPGLSAGDNMVIDSVKALKILEDELQREPFMLEITNL